jgi:hypothetical protein
VARESWFYYGAFKQAIGAGVASKNGTVPITVGSATVWSLAFVNNATGATLGTVVWSPTATAAVVPNVPVPVGSCASVTLVTPTFGLPGGNVTTVPVSGGMAVITATETPVIVGPC